MALTPSSMTPLGTAAPDFHLLDTNGKYISLKDFKPAPALLVAFLCNHCPYVKHVRSAFAHLATEYQLEGCDCHRDQQQRSGHASGR